MSYQGFDNTDKPRDTPQNNQREVIARCPFCGKNIRMKEFRNYIAIQEFKITGLCQDCQDVHSLGHRF